MNHQVTDKQWQSGEMATHERVRELLEHRAHTAEPMVKFSLVNANLSHIDLVNRASKARYQLIDCDFYRADFSNAHCFKLDFSGSSLMKANFSEANLNCTNLTNCNLLGTKFEGAKLENVNWGDQILQEQQATQTSDPELRNDYYEEAEEIYRHLRLVSAKQGLFEKSGVFFQREMVMGRKQMPLFSFARLISKMVDLFCGYGEKPIQVVSFTWVVIAIFTLLYFATGLQVEGQQIIFNSQANLTENINNLFSCLYFSIVTFTTLGYGDITPIGYSRVLAALEAIFGSFTLALFVVVFVKKMTR